MAGRLDTSRAMSDPQNKQSLPLRLLEWAGCVLLIVIGAGVPVFVPWDGLLKALEFDTDRSEYAVGKFMLLMALCGLTIAVGALGLLTPLWRRYRGRVLLPAGALILFIIWTGITVLASPARGYSYYYWLPMGLAAVASLTGPMFMAAATKTRAYLFSVLGAGFLVSFIAVISTLGYRGFYRFVYGRDPRDLVEEGQRLAQGGFARGAAQSTIGNPEYAGTYAAILAAVCAIMLYDWAPKAKYALYARLAALGTLMCLLAHLTFSGSRQPWVALGLAGLLRLFMLLRVPLRAVAAGFCIFILVLLGAGFIWGILFALVATIAGLVFAAMERNGVSVLLQSDRFNLWLTGGGIGAILLVIVAFSVPGPWNPTGLRILQRFASITEGDESVRERNIMFMTASQMVWESPIVGVGPGRYTNRMYPALAELVDADGSGAVYIARDQFGSRIADQTHNDYLQIAAETGIVGLVLFLTSMLFILQGLWRIIHEADDEYRLPALAMLACFVAFFGVMLTSFPLQMPSRSALFWSLVAAALGLIAAATPSGAEAEA